ncbi:hypothetical protein GTO89_02500 [Heliobacterium gestii]|uniref:Uncharacterized protein n=1 Tax=Heliomicrobium gestii TaxID=2699 RepID=A0A845LED5_HELGE|nr:hypothetical protein [Heliomicrobium gestii]MBM7865653.1 hypothetical protein [Heliomicrobium gestii]MZP41903.1 hypothetical protein [Heliomicrobium gestii]
MILLQMNAHRSFLGSGRTYAFALAEPSSGSGAIEPMMSLSCLRGCIGDENAYKCGSKCAGKDLSCFDTCSKDSSASRCISQRCF